MTMTPKQEKENKYQNIFLIVAVSAVIPPAIGFGTGYWTLTGTADRRASEMVVASQAAVCEGQFKQAAGYDQRLKEYKALDSSKQGDYLVKGGWAVLPGQDKANDAVTRACDDRLKRL